MPITFIEDDSIGHECAVCGAARELVMRAVQARSIEQGLTGAALELPACPRCSSVELLIPAGATRVASEDTRVRRHQLIVEIIAARRAKARLPAELEGEIARVFADGIRLRETALEAAADS